MLSGWWCILLHTLKILKTSRTAFWSGVMTVPRDILEGPHHCEPGTWKIVSMDGFASVRTDLIILWELYQTFFGQIWQRKFNKNTLARSRGNRMRVNHTWTTSMSARNTEVHERGCSVVGKGKATPKSHIKSLHNYIHLLHRWLNPFEMQMCTVTQLLVVRLAQVQGNPVFTWDCCTSTKLRTGYWALG